jgi:predicted metal-dependent peptidase
MRTFRQPSAAEMAKKTQVAELAELGRRQLLLNQPFIGMFIMRMDIVPVCDSRLDTAATDGSDIFLDCDFYLRLTPAQRVFLLAHEVWHCVLLHFNRRLGRQRLRWNIAADLEIQFILESENMENPCPLPCRRNWATLNAEEIYDKLPKSAERGNAVDKHIEREDADDDDDEGGKSSAKQKRAKKSDEQKKNGKGGGQSQEEKDDEQDKERKDRKGDSASKKDGKDKDGNGKVAGKMADEQDKDEASELPVYDPDYSPYFAGDITERIRGRVLSVARQVERMRGTLPGKVSGVLEELLEPQLSWQELLAQFVTACYGGKRRWLPPSRRHVHQGLYLPSMRDVELKAVVAVDTSGSTMNDLPQFFGELSSLLGSFGNYELTVIQCDAAIQKVERFSNYEPFDPQQKWRPKGFGGTDFRPVFKYIDAHSELTEAPLIFFTDGGGVAPTQAPPNPVLWLLCADGSCPAPWGREVRMNKRP